MLIRNQGWINVGWINVGERTLVYTEPLFSIQIKFIKLFSTDFFLIHD